MVDRKARNVFAEIVREFIYGQITNFGFEESIPETKDRIIFAIESSLWCFYDDFKEHRLDGEHKLPEKTKNEIARWIIFLLTDEEYRWPDISHPGVRPIEHTFTSKLFNAPEREKKFMNSGDYSVWPFINVESYRNAKKNFIINGDAN